MNQQKRGRGRPIGSNSFVRVSLRDLNRYLREDASVLVSKKFLEEIGLTVQEASPIIPVQPENGAAIPEFKMTEFED